MLAWERKQIAKLQSRTVGDLKFRSLKEHGLTLKENLFQLQRRFQLEAVNMLTHELNPPTSPEMNPKTVHVWLDFLSEDMLGPDFRNINTKHEHLLVHDTCACWVVGN